MCKTLIHNPHIQLAGSNQAQADTIDINLTNRKLEEINEKSRRNLNEISAISNGIIPENVLIEQITEYNLALNEFKRYDIENTRNKGQLDTITKDIERKTKQFQIVQSEFTALNEKMKKNQNLRKDLTVLQSKIDK